MNSRVALILLSIVLLAAIFCQKSEAFTAGAGNIINRRNIRTDHEAAKRLAHVCEAARKSCSILRKTMDNKWIDEDEKRQQQQQE
ncbi:hypothetical protein ACROYT_G011159 [Oculina patagonica]